jgi:hypothetical protein
MAFTKRQSLFVDAFLLHGDGARAARETGYSEKWARKQAVADECRRYEGGRGGAAKKYEAAKTDLVRDFMTAAAEAPERNKPRETNCSYKIGKDLWSSAVIATSYCQPSFGIFRLFFGSVRSFGAKPQGAVADLTAENFGPVRAHVVR